MALGALTVTLSSLAQPSTVRMLRILCHVQNLLAPLYLSLSLTAILSLQVSVLSDLSAHGKTRRRLSRNDDNESLKGRPAFLQSFLSSLIVPKRYFLHFYVFGLLILLWTVGLVVNASSGSDAPAARSNRLLPFSMVLLLLLLTLHLTRRIYECLYIHAWRVDSTMHLAGYALGLLHYALLPVAFMEVCSADAGAHTRRDEWQRPATGAGGPVASTLQVLAAMTVNLWAQYQQHRHHAILANVRRPRREKMEEQHDHHDDKRSEKSQSYKQDYELPETAWFKFVACPHYLAEILIYASLVWLKYCHVPLVTMRESSFIASRGENALQLGPICLFIWVATNLTVSARKNHGWYRRNVVGYKERGMKCIFPGIL